MTTSGSGPALIATGSDAISSPAATNRREVDGVFSWPQLPSTRWCDGEPSELTRTRSPVRVMRVTKRSLASAWMASAPAGPVMVVLQYESTAAAPARTPEYDHES